MLRMDPIVSLSIAVPFCLNTAWRVIRSSTCRGSLRSARRYARYVRELVKRKLAGGS
jgi:hypothetical protein